MGQKKSICLWLNDEQLNQDMTYIIAGNFKGERFIMVDSKAAKLEYENGKSKTTSYQFNQKLLKSSVNFDTYWSMTGYPKLLELLQAKEKEAKDKNLDFVVDILLLESLIIDYEYFIKHQGFNHYQTNVIYYLNKDELKCIELFYDEHYNITRKKVSDIDDGVFRLNMAVSSKITDDTTDIKQFALDKLMNCRSDSKTFFKDYPFSYISNQSELDTNILI